MTRIILATLSIATMSWSCATPTSRLTAAQLKTLTRAGDGFGYRFTNLGDGRDENQLFVCLSFSGGGTRAAALAYGTMIALRQTPIDWPRHETLLDEVDCISSVSGGSFTAAYYGLFRDELFSRFETDFLYKDIQGGLLLQLLYPWNWPRLASPYYSRIDLAGNFYDDRVFDHKTYQDLHTRRPFIILNATDIGRGTRFPFTQNQFDLIGSDLSPYPVARAVAASSAFPFLLSPLTLENYQPVDDYKAPTAYRLDLSDYYSNRSAYFWAQGELKYVDEPLPYVHLMDGGLGDNIGLRSIIDAYEQTNGCIYRNLPEMKRLVIIAVNARTQSTDTISNHHHTPHIIPSVALATATVSMDNYSLDTVDITNQLMAYLEQAEAISRQAPGTPLRAPVPYVTEIGFEAIPNKRAREAFLSIGTSFHLPREQVKALIYMGCSLLKRDPTFLCLLDNIERNAKNNASDSRCTVANSNLHPTGAEHIVCPDPGTWPPALVAFNPDAPSP